MNGDRIYLLCRTMKSGLTGGGLFLFFGAMGLMIYFGKVQVPPYRLTKDFVESTCVVVAKVDYGYLSCSCGVKGKEPCQSSYPCVELIVNYTSGGNEWNTATAYRNSYTLKYHGHAKCSVVTCSEYGNKQRIDEFINMYNTSEKSHRCFYNPAKLRQVILTKSTAGDLAMYLAWPALGMFLGLCVLSYVCWISCCVEDVSDKEDSKPTSKRWRNKWDQSDGYRYRHSRAVV